MIERWRMWTERISGWPCRLIKRVERLAWFFNWYNRLSSNNSFEGRPMSRQRMIVTDDQLLIDMELLFNAIREAGGDWQAVEKDMYLYLASVQGMAEATPDEN